MNFSKLIVPVLLLAIAAAALLSKLGSGRPKTDTNLVLFSTIPQGYGPSNVFRVGVLLGYEAAQRGATNAEEAAYLAQLLTGKHYEEFKRWSNQHPLSNEVRR